MNAEEMKDRTTGSSGRYDRQEPESRCVTADERRAGYSMKKAGEKRAWQIRRDDVIKSSIITALFRVHTKIFHTRQKSLTICTTSVPMSLRCTLRGER